MKQTSLIIFLLSFATIFGQKKSKSTQLVTLKYSGIYEYGKDAEKERVGCISLFAETDSTILFYIDLNRGAPSYNMGSLYGRVRIQTNSGTFYKQSSYSDEGCKWLFTFSKNNVIIKTLDGQHSCDFGHNVFADGTFKRKKAIQPNSFINQLGETVFFDKTKPEDYKE
jgi:hypothetical protein